MPTNTIDYAAYSREYAARRAELLAWVNSHGIADFLALTDADIERLAIEYAADAYAKVDGANCSDAEAWERYLGIAEPDIRAAFDERLVLRRAGLVEAAGYADDDLIIEARRPDGDEVIFEVERPEGEGMGLELEPPTIRRCANRCEFCFIEGLPKGLRKPLYIRDDDYRLSFAYGNFATLSNLKDRDFDRI